MSGKPHAVCQKDGKSCSSSLTPCWEELRCPKCEGPAVRIEQSGLLHCSNQCEEKEADRNKRLLLQHLTADIARLLKPALPKDIGFLIILADYEIGGMGYACTMERDGAISLLQEMADKLRQDEKVAAHLVKTTIAKAVKGDG